MSVSQSLSGMTDRFHLPLAAVVVKAARKRTKKRTMLITIKGSSFSGKLKLETFSSS
jgi:hypothetical protein